MTAVVPAVSLAGLTVRYADTARPALDGVSVEIAAGEMVGIVGLNGAGKSTLGRCLNGIVPHLVPADISGRILVAGTDPATTPVREMARLVGVTLDNPEAQMSQPTVAEEIALGLEGLGTPWAEMRSRVVETLRIAGLAHLEHRDPLGLSGGEQQRVAIASVFAMRPAVLYLDEPASALDPRSRLEVFDLAARLCREEGMTVLVADHHVEVLASHCGRILVLDEGRLARDGPTREVFTALARDPAHRMGVPQVTEVAAALSGAGDWRLPVTVPEAVRWLQERS